MVLRRLRDRHGRRGRIGEGLVTQRDAQIHAHADATGSVFGGVVSRLREPPLRVRVQDPPEVDPGRPEAGRVESARRHCAAARLVLREQHDPVRGRGLPLQDLGLLWPVALQQRAPRPRCHVRGLVAHGQALRGGVLQLGEAVRPHGLVLLPRVARDGVHLRHLVVQRRHAVRVRLWQRVRRPRQPRRSYDILAEHRRDAGREQLDHCARRAERDSGGSGRLQGQSDGHVPRIRSPGCHNEHPVLHLPAEQLEHASRRGPEGAAHPDRAVPLSLRAGRRARHPGAFLRGAEAIQHRLQRPPHRVPEPPDTQHMQGRRGPLRPILAEADPRLRRLHGPAHRAAAPAQARRRPHLHEPDGVWVGPQDRHPGQEQGPLPHQGHAGGPGREAGQHGRNLHVERFYGHAGCSDGR
mmetsp:Transcript_21425/g.55867  ORF Transcript_21425/g.55867 Transcript_21425/m.55867 type:complete len:410 (+) Transcript_21425:431-1660(+)